MLTEPLLVQPLALIKNQRMTWRVEDIVQAKRREVQLSELGKQQHCTIR